MTLAPKPEELSAIRFGAELSNFKPYLDTEVASLQKAVVSSVLSAVNAGTLTPEMAMSKWMEFISYTKLNQKLSQRIQVGVSVGSTRNLDIPV